MTASPRRAVNDKDVTSSDDREAIHRIREILVGAHQKQYDTRLQDFGDRLEAAIAELRGEFHSQMQELQDRTEAMFRELRETLKEQGSSQRSDLERLDQRLTDALQAQQAAAATSLQETTGELRDTLVNRGALASLLAELARTLGADDGSTKAPEGDA